MIRADIPGVWQTLFARAILLIDDLEKRTGQAPFWTFGGGTVLMLRFFHRQSKDIDIFFPDPQSLGYLNPRIGGLAESLTTEYADSADHLKLFFPEGEIDFVASPNLTQPGFELATLDSREIRLETAVEIIAKKMWHRGNEAKARDLFDLCVVIDRSRDDLVVASSLLLKNRRAFLHQLTKRRDILRTQFDEIDCIAPSFRPDALANISACACAFLNATPRASASCESESLAV